MSGKVYNDLEIKQNVNVRSGRGQVLAQLRPKCQELRKGQWSVESPRG